MILLARDVVSIYKWCQFCKLERKLVAGFNGKED